MPGETLERDLGVRAQLPKSHALHLPGGPCRDPPPTMPWQCGRICISWTPALGSPPAPEPLSALGLVIMGIFWPSRSVSRSGLVGRVVEEVLQLNETVLIMRHSVPLFGDPEA